MVWNIVPPRYFLDDESESIDPWVNSNRASSPTFLLSRVDYSPEVFRDETPFPDDHQKSLQFSPWLNSIREPLVLVPLQGHIQSYAFLR